MRQKDDFYPTPPEAVEALLSVEKFIGDIWEPACGDGAISKVLEREHNVVSSDLNDYGFGESGVDFLMEQELQAQSIVTNPPYKNATDFVRHAIRLGAKKHCWLLRLAFLEGKARNENIFSKTKPARVWVFSKRLTIWRGDEEKSGSGTTAYAWFVWEGVSNTTELGWIL